MKTERKIFTNTITMAAGKIAGDLATFVFLIYFARVFGTIYFGQYAFAMSLGGFLSILVGLGLNKLVIREISKDKSQDAKYMGNMLATQCVLAVLSWSLIALIVLLADFDHTTQSITLIIGSYQILYKFTQLIHSQFKAHEDMEYSAFLEIYHKVVILLFGSLAIMLWKDPVITLLIYPVSGFSMFVIGQWLALRKYGRPDFNIDLPFIGSLLYRAFPFLLLIILGQFYDRIGVILLTALHGDEATGIYAATDRLLVTIITGLAMFGAALFPVMSRYAKDEPQKLVATYERSVRIVIVSILPAATFLYLLSEQVILMLYGKTFNQSGDVLSIMSWTILPSGLNYILISVLIATDQQNKVVKIQLSIVAGFIIASILLIPAFSYIGLAYAKLLTSIALCLAYTWHLSTTLHYSAALRNLKAPLITCMITILLFKVLVDYSLLLATLSALLACIGILLLSGAIKRHDVNYLKNILLKRTSD